VAERHHVERPAGERPHADRPARDARPAANVEGRDRRPGDWYPHDRRSNDRPFRGRSTGRPTYRASRSY
jgi:hypothetical protein